MHSSRATRATTRAVIFVVDEACKCLFFVLASMAFSFLTLKEPENIHIEETAIRELKPFSKIETNC